MYGVPRLPRDTLTFMVKKDSKLNVEKARKEIALPLRLTPYTCIHTGTTFIHTRMQVYEVAVTELPGYEKCSHSDFSESILFRFSSGFWPICNMNYSCLPFSQGL